MKFRELINLPCSEVTRLLSESMDRKIPFHLRLGILWHIRICKWCKWYQEQLRFLRKALRWRASKEEIPPSAPLSSEAKERLKKAMRPGNEEK